MDKIFITIYHSFVVTPFDIFSSIQSYFWSKKINMMLKLLNMEGRKEGRKEGQTEGRKRRQGRKMEGRKERP